MRNFWNLFAMTLGATLWACGSDAPDDNPGGGGSGAGGEGAGGTMTTGTGGTATGSTSSSGGGGTMEVCAPTDVSDFVPTWVPPQAIYQDVCSDTAITAIAAACFGPAADDVACATVLDDNPTCASCARTVETAPEHGAMIRYPSRGFSDRNFPGCFAHAEGDLSENGCGAMVKAASDCVIESCAGCIPVATPGELDALNACVGEAAQTECADYFTDAMACTATLSGPIADACPWGNEPFEALADRYMRLFCGAAPP